MNGASLCNSLLLHSRFKSPCSIPSSSSPSCAYLVSPCFTTSAHISFPRAVVIKRSDVFRSLAVNKRRSSTEEDVEEEEEDEEDWDEFDEDEGEEDEGEFLPMEKMKQWLEKKPRGFGVGKKYDTLIEDKLLEEIEQSWKAQAANLNNLKTNDPLKRDHNNNNNNNLIKGETQSGFRVRVTNLPKKKNVHRDLKAAFKEVSGVLNIAPAVSGNKKTKDPVCKGFALVDFKTGVDANRFVEQFNGQRLSFGKVVKQIKCQVVEFAASNQSVSEELRSDTVFEELPFPGFEAVSSVDVVVEEDGFVDSWEEESSDDSVKDVDETEVEEEDERFIESPKVHTNVRSQKQAVKRETREHELETPLVSFQAVSKSWEAVAEAHVDDDDDDDEHDRSDEEEEVAEETLEPLSSSVSSSDEERIERIRRLELKLLGREKLLGGGAGSDKPEAKTGGRVEGEKKKEKKKKKKKILVKGKKSSTIEIPGSSKRLKMKEKALLTGVLVKYAAKAASTSNEE